MQRFIQWLEPQSRESLAISGVVLVMLIAIADYLTGYQYEEWAVMVSIGIATFVRPPHSMDTLLQQADDLMHIAKRSGKNQIKHAIFGV